MTPQTETELSVHRYMIRSLEREREERAREPAAVARLDERLANTRAMIARLEAGLPSVGRRGEDVGDDEDRLVAQVLAVHRSRSVAGANGDSAERRTVLTELRKEIDARAGSEEDALVESMLSAHRASRGEPHPEGGS